jgi:hypothetical protein
MLNISMGIIKPSPHKNKNERDISTGDTFQYERYEVLRQLSGGGQGLVYLVEDKTNNLV